LDVISDYHFSMCSFFIVCFCVFFSCSFAVSGTGLTLPMAVVPAY